MRYEIVSTGSYWLIDEVSMTYVRLPRGHGPRDPEWSKGVLKDEMWLPMTGWYVQMSYGGPRLFIEVPLEGHIVNAPLPVDEYNKWMALGKGKEGIRGRS